MKKFESDVCPYCELEENEDLTPPKSIVPIDIEDGMLRSRYDNYNDKYYTSKVRINYCPMCGRKLE